MKWITELESSTIDTTVLNTTLADYQRRLVDNIYNSNVVLRLADEAGNKA